MKKNETTKQTKEVVRHLTKGVIRINVGVGYIPATNGSINATAVATLPGWAHGQAQHRAVVGPECVHRLNVQ